MQFVGESFWEYIWLVIYKNIKKPPIYLPSLRLTFPSAKVVREQALANFN